MKILVSDKLSDEGVRILREGGLDVDVNIGLKPEELKAIIGSQLIIPLSQREID